LRCHWKLGLNLRPALVRPTRLFLLLHRRRESSGALRFASADCLQRLRFVEVPSSLASLCNRPSADSTQVLRLRCAPLRMTASLTVTNWWQPVWVTSWGGQRFRHPPRCRSRFCGFPPFPPEKAERMGHPGLLLVRAADEKAELTPLTSRAPPTPLTFCRRRPHTRRR